jgi:toxoflavin biosynthesis protein ToxD
MTRFLSYLMLLGTIAIAINGCQLSQSASSPPLITNQNCQTDNSFVFIPEGEFVLGSDRQERDYAYSISAQAIATETNAMRRAEQKLRQTGWFDRETTRQTASLPGFCISRNLVTNQEYQAFIRETNYQAPGITEVEYQKQGFLVHPYSKVQTFLWTNRTYPAGKEQHPVVLVSYEDALAFADWKGEKTGATYRLPTATEWEKAARGKDGRYFPWGNNWQDDATNSAVSSLNYTSAIATYPSSRSPYGVEDMAGNVFEFTSTSKWQATRVVMKGCSWDDLPGFCRAAYQHTRPRTSHHILFGFRLVISS